MTVANPTPPRFTIHHCLPSEVERALAIRITVFVEEQKFTMEEELDGKDFDADHFLLIDNSTSPPTDAGTIRYNRSGKLERLAVLKPYRAGLGSGSKLVKGMEEFIQTKVKNEKGEVKVKCHGQVQAKVFYEKLGYVVEGEEFIEDNQPHILLTKTIKLSN